LPACPAARGVAPSRAADAVGQGDARRWARRRARARHGRDGARALRRYAATGTVDYLIISVPLGDMTRAGTERTLHVFIVDVMPALREL
jgi:hypothetical protein